MDARKRKRRGGQKRQEDLDRRHGHREEVSHMFHISRSQMIYMYVQRQCISILYYIISKSLLIQQRPVFPFFVSLFLCAVSNRHVDYKSSAMFPASFHINNLLPKSNPQSSVAVRANTSQLIFHRLLLLLLPLRQLLLILLLVLAATFSHSRHLLFSFRSSCWRCSRGLRVLGKRCGL